MFKNLIHLSFITLFLVLSGCKTVPLADKNIQDVTTALIAQNTVTLESFSKNLGPPGGIISNELGDTLIQIPENALVTDTTFKFSRTLDSYGTLVSKIEADNYVAPFEIILPETAFLSHIVPNNKQFQKIRGDKENITLDKQTYPLRYTWYTQLAHFWRTSGQVGLGNRIQGQITVRTEQKPHFLTTIQEAVRLTGNCTKEAIDCYRNKEPVLFIHGYIPSLNGLGGGEKTWKNFPALILKLNPKYTVFEFQWMTAARFEDVATDLGKAIEQIAQATGKKVHIIAHSFGGILARTYLQGLAANFPYREQVASVTTIGTPHSGILSEDKVLHNVAFKRGQDTQGLLSGEVQIGFCQQISCYQMGEFVDFTEDELKILKLNYPDRFFNPTLNVDKTLIDVPDDLDLHNKPGKFISVLSDTTQNPLPAGLPIQVLIGLTAQPTEVQAGDALISYAGQRLIPELSTAGLLNMSTRYGSNVTESVLGFEEISPPSSNPLFPENPNYWGYRHSDAPVGTLLKASPMVQIECEQVENCQHATFNKVKTWLVQHPASEVKTTLQPRSATVKVINAKTQQPIPFAYIRVYRMRSDNARLFSDTDPLIVLQQTDEKGETIVYLPNTLNVLYYLRVQAWGFYGAQQTSPLKLTTTASPLHFKTVPLNPKPERKQIVGNVVEATNKILEEVTYVVYNHQRWWSGQTDKQGHFIITGLVPGNTEIYFLRERYAVAKLSLNVNQQTIEKVYAVKMRLDQEN